MKTLIFQRFGLILVILLLLVTIALSSCVTIQNIDQPLYTKTNSIFTTTVTAYPDSSGDGQPYFGVHLPEEWAVIEPVRYMGNYTGDLTYNAGLSAQMEGLSPKTGYYWWVGEGDTHSVSEPGQTATGTLRLQTGNQTGFYYLDYMTGDSHDGLNSDLKENFPITVTANYGAGWRTIRPPKYVASNVTTLTISTTLVNLGEAGYDSFELSVTPPVGWSANFFTTTIITNTEPMMLFQSLPLTIQVVLPAVISPGTKTISISATSSTQANATTSDLINIILLSDERGYALTDNNEVLTIDPATHQTTDRPQNLVSYAESLAIHPDQAYVYVSFPDNVLISPGYHVLFIGNTITGETNMHLLVDGAELGVIMFTCNGNKALISDRSNNKLFFLHTTNPRFPTQIGTITTLPDIVHKIAVGGCGSNLALTTHKGNNSVAVIDTNSMNLVKTISGFNNPGDIVITPDGRRAYVANTDGTIGVIDLVNQTLLDTLNVGNTTLSQLAISPDSQLLYIGSANRFSIWGFSTPDIYFPGDIQDIEISPDGQKIFVAHNQSTDSRADSAISIIQTGNDQVIDTIRLQDSLRKLTLFAPSCNCQQTYLPVVLEK